MVQAVIADGGEEVSVPDRRIGLHVGVGIGGDHAAAGDRGEQRIQIDIEQRSHPDADQEQLDRIADKALHRIELRDVMMRRMGQPQGRPVVHRAVHPVLAEFESEHHHHHLHDEGAGGEPRGGDAPSLLQFAQRRVDQRVAGKADRTVTEGDIEDVGCQLAPVDAPALVAFEHQFEQLDKGKCNKADDDDGPRPIHPGRRRKAPERNHCGERGRRQQIDERLFHRIVPRAWYLDAGFGLRVSAGKYAILRRSSRGRALRPFRDRRTGTRRRPAA